MGNSQVHILIVDDDDRIRNLLKDFLSKNNFIVSTAEDADEAKIKIGYLKFDLIILDVMMPGQSGYELTKEIKNNNLTEGVNELVRENKLNITRYNLEFYVVCNTCKIN